VQAASKPSGTDTGGVAMVLPETPLFLRMYVRKEAVLSSQIEGTQSTLISSTAVRGKKSMSNKHQT